MTSRGPAVAVALLVAVACAAALAIGAGTGARPSAARCADEGRSAGLASGRELAAVVHNELVEAGSQESSGCPAARRVVPGAVLRHVAQLPGAGTAFVQDLAGPDELEVVTGAGTVTTRAGGEITHPAWSPDGRLAYAVDLEHVEVWKPGSSRVETVARPRAAGGLFSPVWPSNDSLVAIAPERLAGVPGEDAGLDNLWRYDLEARSWKRITDFSVSGDRWSALRTPVVDEEGAVLFVRVSGRWSSSGLPSFELWRARGSRVKRLGALQGEMYLAGWDGGRLVYNAPSARCEGWELLRESASGLDGLGCGVTLADPLDSIDPDFMDAGSNPAEPRPPEFALGVVVGDFDRRSEAGELARDLGRSPGQRVAGHRDAPHAVAPGAWVVLRPVPEGTSPRAALRDLRARLAGAADAWLAPLPPSD